MITLRLSLLTFAASLSLAGTALAQSVTQLPPDLARRIDRTVAESLAKTGAPSASVAIVRDGKLVYAKAYGLAQLKPARPANASMRYAVASNSKEFTAVAVLMLADEGKLSLDDKVSRWYPDLTSADQITVRQLLSHTSGYSDFWPQDYVMKPMLSPTSPDAIISDWARKPLDYTPGSAWQYSNTGYVIAARIVEKVTGETLFGYLQRKVFTPLEMKSVVDNDQHRILSPDATPYTRIALGPNRPAPREGAGWMYGAGELAMTAADLARWDASLITRNFLSPKAYEALTTPIRLTNGEDSGYGLGLFIDKEQGHLVYHHGGEVSGFLSENRIYPDDGLALVVETSSDAASAQRDIASRLAFELLPPKGQDADARALVEGLIQGRLDRTRITPNLDAYYTPAAVADASKALSSLGELRAVIARGKNLRGGMTFRGYRAVFAKGTATVSLYFTPDGKAEQLLITPLGD
jgi:CubicO group peptidase (beta-lactamase class C family)